MRLTVFHVTPPPAAAGAANGSHAGVRPKGDLITGSRWSTTCGPPRSAPVQGGHLPGPVAGDHLLAGGHPLHLQRHRVAPHTRRERGTQSGSARAAASTLGPAALPSPLPRPTTFTARVAITDFVSRLLPAPPHPGGARAGRCHGRRPGGGPAAEASGPGTHVRVTAGLNTAGSVRRAAAGGHRPPPGALPRPPGPTGRRDPAGPPGGRHGHHAGRRGAGAGQLVPLRAVPLHPVAAGDQRPRPAGRSSSRSPRPATASSSPGPTGCWPAPSASRPAWRSASPPARPGPGTRSP